MKVITCDNSYKDQWHEFVVKNSADFGLLQSWEWGVLQATLGRKVLRFALMEHDRIIALAQVVRHKLKFGRSYFYLPRGPIVINDESLAIKQLEILELLFNEIKSLAKVEKAIFLRLDPAWKDNEPLVKILKEAGLIFVGQVQPKSTFILDLSQSEDELLTNMKPKTRYNIKVAQKNEVKIDKGEKYFEEFWALMGQTAERNEIIPHPKNYYKKLLQILGENHLAELVVAKYDNQVIAANIMISIGDWQVYFYGASDYQYRNKMAPYLLQWQAVLNAKISGAKYYDFWGIDDLKWPGITRFKTGFDQTSEPTNYIGAWDEVYRGLWYNIYKFLKKMQK